MKKLRTITRVSSLAFIVGSLCIVSRVVAQTPASPSATPEDNSRQVEELKERLATKVAELKNFQQRAIFGTVRDISVATFTVETATKQIKIELTDDLKVVQYVRGKRTQLTEEDIDTGDMVAVFGDYDESLDLLRAKVLFIQGTLPTIISGTVREINRADFTLTLKTRDGQDYIVDIETSTKSDLWIKGEGVSKGGFSKIRVGETLHVVGSDYNEKEHRMSADRILDLGSLASPTATVQPSPEP